MSKARVVSLGGVDYPLGKFTVGDVVMLTPSLKQSFTGATVPEMQAQASLVHLGIKTGGYAGSFTDFMALPDVTPVELEAAQVTIGRAIGFYKDAPEPGEVSGDVASP